MFLSVLDFLKNNQIRIFDFLSGLSVGIIILIIERIINKKDKKKDAKEEQKIFGNKRINKIIDEELEALNPLLRDYGKVAITQNMKKNWWLDEICLSKMKVDLANVIFQNTNNDGYIGFSKSTADRIINNIVAKIKE